MICCKLALFCTDMQWKKFVNEIFWPGLKQPWNFVVNAWSASEGIEHLKTKTSVG